jgi:hypothetical protein
MPAAPRHSKPMKPAMTLAKTKNPAVKLGIPVLAAVTLAGVAAAFVFLAHRPGAAAASQDTRATTTTTTTAAASGLTADELTLNVQHQVASRAVRHAAVAIRHHYLAARAHASRAAAARLAHQRAVQQAAQQAAAQQAAAQPAPTPSASPAATLSSGSDPAHSPLGVCIRNAEEGGSYAWGPGNGGGAYQFTLGTWEAYGGAAGEFGVAGPAYQDQIFDNAINAGGASNWTAYDGC